MIKLYNPFRAHLARLPTGNYVIRRLMPWGMWLYLDIDWLELEAKVKWRTKHTMKGQRRCVRRDLGYLLEAWNILQERRLLCLAVRGLTRLVGYWGTDGSRISVEEAKKHAMLFKLKTPPSENKDH